MNDRYGLAHSRYSAKLPIMNTDTSLLLRLLFTEEPPHLADTCVPG